MKLRRTVMPLRGPIDMAPLIDVVLLLLIFFILSSSFVLQPGIKIQLPRMVSGLNRGVTDSGYMLAVTAGNPPHVFFNDQVSGLDKLPEQFRTVAAKDDGATVILKADEDVANGIVVQIMNQALQAGLNVVIATQPAGAATPVSAGN
jgi:biopolymer transport protein ExbD